MASPLAVSETHPGSHLLAEAVDRGDESRVKALLLAGADPNDRTQEGLTVLMRAIINGHKCIAALLIENDADVNARRDDGFTPLLFAAFFGQYDLICLLLEKGADVHAQSKFETSAEMWASARGFTEIAALLRRTSPDEIPIRSVRPQDDDVKRPVAAVAKTASPQAVPDPAYARHQRFRKRTRSVLSSKQIGVLAVSALLISGICTYYALRMGDEDSSAAATERQVNFVPSLATTRELPSNRQNQSQVSVTNIAELSKSLSGSPTDQHQHQQRVSDSHRDLDVKLQREKASPRADLGKVFQLPSQSIANDKSKHVVTGEPAEARGKKEVTDSAEAGGGRKEMPEMRPAVEVERTPPHPSTAGPSKIIENNSMQSVSSPSPSGPKHKVIRWP